MRRDYEVGYKKPPKHSRFKSGTSGNPNGRPKGSKNLQKIMEQRLNTKVTIVEKGRRKQITMGELIVLKLVNDAAAGDAVARRELLKFMDQFDQQPEQKGFKIIYLDAEDAKA